MDGSTFEARHAETHVARTAMPSRTHVICPPTGRVALIPGVQRFGVTESNTALDWRSGSASVSRDFRLTPLTRTIPRPASGAFRCTSWTWRREKPLYRERLPLRGFGANSAITKSSLKARMDRSPIELGKPPDRAYLALQQRHGEQPENRTAGEVPPFASHVVRNPSAPIPSEAAL